MTALLAFLIAPLARVSPFILRKVTPILATASTRVWKSAYPIALNIVKDLADNGHLDGMDKHKAAVQRLGQELIATGKFTEAEIGKLHLIQIVAAAYYNEMVK